MKKASTSDYLTPGEKRGAMEAALTGGMEPAEVFKAILQNVFGISNRKKMVIDWGQKMGLEASESLRVAQAANLIANSRPPRESFQKKPGSKTSGKTSG